MNYTEIVPACTSPDRAAGRPFCAPGRHGHLPALFLRELPEAALRERLALLVAIEQEALGAALAAYDRAGRSLPHSGPRAEWSARAAALLAAAEPVEEEIANLRLLLGVERRPQRVEGGGR